MNLEANGNDRELIALEPIKEVGNHIDPMLSIIAFEGEDVGALTIKPEARAAQTAFNENSSIMGLVPSSDEMSQYNGDLVKLKREIIANVITQGASIEDEMQRFIDEGGAEWSQMIVDSLNK